MCARASIRLACIAGTCQILVISSFIRSSGWHCAKPSKLNLAFLKTFGLENFYLAFLDKFSLGINVKFWLCFGFFQQEGRNDVTYSSSSGFKLQSFDR